MDTLTIAATLRDAARSLRASDDPKARILADLLDWIAAELVG